MSLVGTGDPAPICTILPRTPQTHRQAVETALNEGGVSARKLMVRL